MQHCLVDINMPLVPYFCIHMVLYFWTARIEGWRKQSGVNKRVVAGEREREIVKAHCEKPQQWKGGDKWEHMGSWCENVKVATVRAVKLMWADYPGIPDISEIHFSDSTKLPTLKTSCSQICGFMRKRGKRGGGRADSRTANSRSSTPSYPFCILTSFCHPFVLTIDQLNSIFRDGQ